MIFLGGIVVLERADLHEEFLAAAALDLRDTLHRLSGAFVCEVNAGLVLAAAVVALPVLHRGVDDIEVGQQQRVEAHLLGVVFHPHGLPKAGLSLADGLVIGVRLAGAVGIAALGVDNAGDGLHQLFHAPEAAARQIDDIVCGIHIGDLLVGPVKCRSVHVCFLSALFLRHSLLPGGAAAQQQHRGEKHGQYTSIHRVSSFRGIRTHSDPSLSCSSLRSGRRTVYSSDPRMHPMPAKSHGPEVIAQVSAAQPA